ncbi:MAG: AMP-binding protein [Deltaproteobacteria bacterium]|nr:MAG: AMP-binding protein [Deltaproteobacteria bacterium]
MASYADKPWLKSYRLGPFKLKTTIEYPKKPLFTILDEAAERFPTKDAYHYLGERVKYRELKLQVDRLANALANIGVAKKDRVIVFLPTCPQFILSDFAILKVGATLVPCSPLLKAPELRHQAQESGAETIICLENHLDLVNSIKGETGLRNIIITSAEDYSPSEAPEVKEIAGTYQLRKMIADHEAKPPEVSIDPDEDLAILAFTGGSTGVPKGVMLTHRQRLTNILQGLPWMMAPFPNYQGSASCLLAVPLFHAYGHYLMQSSMYWGLRLFLVPDPRDTKMIVQLMNEYRPFLLFMVPTQLLKLAQPEVALKRMPVLVMSGTAPLPAEVSHRIEEKIKMPISEGYGLTETGPATHINISAFAKVTRFATSTRPGIGLPLPDTEVKAVDPVTEKEVPFGEVGEIWVRGPQVMRGYWPHDGSGLEPGGWLRTGDLAKMDEDGYFHVVDRIKDMINISGMKVYSIEIDEVLFKHPAVEGAVTIGIPDPERPGSERIKAFVKLRDDFKKKVAAQEIIDYCRENLAAYAVPKFIEFRDDLPVTVAEKIFKRALREEEIKQMKQRGEI